MYQRYIYLLFFVISTSYYVSAQHAKVLDTSTIENKLQYRLQQFLDQLDYEKAITIIDSIELYSIQHNKPLVRAYAYDAKTVIYRFKQDIPNAKTFVKKSIKIYETYQRHNHLVALNAHLANILRAEGKLDSCLQLLNETSKKYISDSISRRNLRYFYNEKDISHYLAGRIDSSLHYTFKKIVLADDNDYYDLGISYTILAKNFYTVNDFSKALIYINKSLDYLSKGKYTYDTARCNAYLLKGKILLNLNRYDEVELCTKTIFTLIKNKNQFESKAQASILLSKLYWKRKQYEKIPTSDSFIKNHKNISYGTLFEFYNLKLEQAIYNTSLKEAGKLIQTLDSLVPKISRLKSKESFYKLSANYWAAIENFEKSYHSQNQHLKIKEKINTRQQTYAAYDLDQKYQLVKKNEEIVQQNFVLQEKENQLLVKEKQQTFLTLSTISAVLGFIVLFLVYRQYQRTKNGEILALHHKQEIIKLESLIQGEEKERKRLAQDLHDGINGDLSAIKFKMTSIDGARLNEKEKRFQQDAIKMLDNTVDQVRRISHNLAPSSLQNFDVIQALQQFCRKINDSNNIRINFQYYGDLLILDTEKENNIYRMIQELINNIIKHAKATEALIQFNNHQNKLLITVEDNGVGFDKNLVVNDGIGLHNIKSRVSLLNASLDIQSSSEGTSITIEIYLT